MKAFKREYEILKVKENFITRLIPINSEYVIISANHEIEEGENKEAKQIKFSPIQQVLYVENKKNSNLRIGDLVDIDLVNILRLIGPNILSPQNQGLVYQLYDEKEDKVSLVFRVPLSLIFAKVQIIEKEISYEVPTSVSIKEEDLPKQEQNRGKEIIIKEEE